MNDLRSLLVAARRRLALGRFLRGLHVGLVAAGVLCLLLVLLAKSSPAVALPWLWILVAMAVAIVAAGIAATRIGRPSELSVATLVDERLGLKERFSTALAVRERSDPFAMAAVADAVATARDKRVRESLGRGVPVKSPDNAWIGPALLIAAGAIAWLAPQADLFRSNGGEDELLEVARREASTAVREVERRIEENAKLSEALGVKTDAPLADEQLSPKELQKIPEEVRREAIRRMTDLQRKLDEVLKSEDALKLDALRQQLAKLDASQNETKDLTEALKAGDFAEAKQALEELRKQAAEKGDAERANLEQQLKDVAKQLEQLASRQEALQEALEKAGLDGKLASNPEAMKQAIENAGNLSQAQREALEKAMNAQRAAQEQMKGMSEAMKRDAQQMCQGGGQKQGQGQQGQSGQQNQQGQQGSEGGQGGQGAEGLEGMLSDMESLSQMLMAAEAAAAEASSQCQQSGKGMGQMAGSCKSNSDSDDWSMINGIREGGRGRAGGGETPTAPTPTATRMQRERVERTDGPIIMRQLIEGKTVAGESSVGVERVAAEIAKSMEQGVNEEQVPAHLRGVHKHYFGEVPKRIESRRAEQPATPPAGPAAPTEPKR